MARSNEELDAQPGTVALRITSLLIVIALGFYILGAMGAESLDPRVVVTFLSREIPGLVMYQLNLIHKSFIDYNLLGIFASLTFILTVGSSLSLLLFEIVFFSIKHNSFHAGWRSSSLYRLIYGDKSERTDIYLYVYYCLGFDRFAVAALGLLGPFFIYGLLVNGRSLGFGESLPPLLAFLAFVLMNDFFGYWFHRIAHKTPALWELHKFHHGALSMNFITAHRNHPFEVVMQLPLKAIPIIVLGPQLHEYLIYSALHHFIILLQHSTFTVSFGPLERVFVSPRFHQVHHSMKPEHFDKNFGVMFAFWDDLFGSRYRGKQFHPAYGVTENYFNQDGFVHDVYQPIRRFYRALIYPSEIK